jgi:O-antigen ligase
LVALPGLFIAGGALWERLTEAATLADRGAGRLDIWRVGWAVFTSHPVLGIGLGCFPIIYLSFLSRATGISAKHVEAVLEKSQKFPHNIYVGTAAEGGVVGIALLGATLAAHLRAAVGSWRALAAQRHPAAGLALVAVAALVAFVVEGATFDIAHRKYFWLTLGLATIGRQWVAATRSVAPGLRRAA